MTGVDCSMVWLITSEPGEEGRLNMINDHRQCGDGESDDNEYDNVMMKMLMEKTMLKCCCWFC